MKKIDATRVPFVKFLGIARCAPPASDSLMLPEAEHYANHLNTVHASAQFALGEATSGAYLLQRFEDLAVTKTFIAVVRKAEVKFKQPARGTVKGTASVTEPVVSRTLTSVATKGWALIPVLVQVMDSRDSITMTATYEWFIKEVAPAPAPRPKPCAITRNHNPYHGADHYARTPELQHPA